MSKPPCDYCGNPAHYMFGDGEVVCSACNIRLPHSSRGARKRIAELERENAVLRAQVETLLTWQELAFVAHPNIDMDMSALAKIKEAS